ncbi:MAG: acyltransferase domain-containing protein, partial [Nocardiopsaceae bacterium]|nr:acyltransferase domain-containing protein [Nocardiopsaceae bacterium]
RPRRAGVSSFGISGTNAHVILEEAPAASLEADVSPEASVSPEGGAGAGSVGSGGLVAWPVSARTAAGLAAQAGRLRAWVAGREGLAAADVGWSLAATRSVLEHRAVVTGVGRGELLAGLAAIERDEPAGNVVTGRAGDTGQAVFVFPGQGGQWAGMGAELAREHPAFAERLAECAAALDPLTGWPLLGVINRQAGAPPLERVDVVQPALWAVMVSLAAAWEDFGVTPAAVAGHSQGEIAAACVAGILTLPDAAAVVAIRSKALAALAGTGAMASLRLPAERAARLVADRGGRLAVAAVNSPDSVVVSGPPEAVDELVGWCEREGIQARPLSVDYASHGEQVEPVRDELLAALDGIEPAAGRVPFYSAVTGRLMDGRECGTAYWYRNLREPVRFEEVTRALLADGYEVFIESSPHPVLAAAIEETVASQAAPGSADAVGPADALGPVASAVGSLRRDQGGLERLVRSAAEAFTAGVPVAWERIGGLRGGQRVDLPTYAFQRRRFWLASGGGPGGAAGAAGPGHPLLGVVVEVADEGGVLLTGGLSVAGHPWLADHVVR